MIDELRQVDLAFRERLKGLKIDDEEVSVFYITPEGEFAIEKYPAIVVFRSGAYPANDRWYNDVIRYDWQYFDNGNPKSVMEKPNPTPYNVYYSIRLYYKFQEDGAKLNTHVANVFRRGTYIVIGQDKYDVELVSYKNPNATYREFGEVKQNEVRTFVDQYLLKVEINLETGISNEKVFMLPESEGGGFDINEEIHGITKK